MKVLVTGANSFVGQALLRRMAGTLGTHVVAAVRRRGEGSAQISANQTTVVLGMEPPIAHVDWSAALVGVDVVVHLAARVHVIQDASIEPVSAFRAVNVDGTLNLARQCGKAGVKRFVFVSSIKVNGEATEQGHPFTESDQPSPHGAYALSKLEAEQGLRDLSAQIGMQIVVIRPPLVYGSGVKANFAALIHAVRRGWPLPLGLVRNQRSLVALDNLVDLLVVCLSHPAAANETFLVSDGHDVSTAELIRLIAQALGARPRLVPVPIPILRAAAAMLGKREALQRLCGNLQVDISKARRVLGWSPPVTVEEGLYRAVSGDGEP